MNIIFWGSDDFALEHLKALFKSKHRVLACVTSADKPKGRGLNISYSPIKELAQENGVPIFQPRFLDASFVDQLKSLNSDLFIVIAYGKILTLDILRIPSLCAMNVHASLLPRYRGAAPINWAIIRGEKQTGLSIIKMNAGLDSGEIIDQFKIDIDPQETAGTLKMKMTQIGPQFLLKTIDSLGRNAYTLKVQDETEVTLAPKLTKELGHIDWNKEALDIHRLARGLLPWPSAYTFYKGKLLKILSTEVAFENFSQAPPTADRFPKGTGQEGEVIKISKEGFIIATGSQGILIKEVHLEASKPMAAWQFVQGHGLELGYKF